MNEAGRVPPHNLDAEESLLGAMLLTPTAIEHAQDLVRSSDFYLPNHGVLFDVIMGMYQRGLPVDALTVADELRRDGSLARIGGAAELVTLQSVTPATSNAGRYARIVVELAGLRRVIAIAESMADAAFAEKELAEIVEGVEEAMSTIALPIETLPDGLLSVDEFLDAGPEAMPEWVIPGVLRVGWRCLFVAEEGAGKTLVGQQLALGASQGVHPFTGTRMAKVRTLMVDCENPHERLLDGFTMVNNGLKTPDYERDQAWLWHRPGGIDIRKRVDRAALEAVIADVRPKLVCIGPMYKVYRVSARESDEQAAAEVMGILDDLRTRYGFALYMEHHAPKKQGGFRELQPYGSSLWLRWPEFGIAMQRDAKRNSEFENTHYRLGRFRQDRVQNSWPSGLSRSKTGFPWAASWEEDGWKDILRDDVDDGGLSPF